MSFRSAPAGSYLNSGPASKVFGGWEMSGIWTMRTGRPVEYHGHPQFQRPAGRQQPRPSAQPGPRRSGLPRWRPDVRQWLNPAAFSVPASRTWGNLGRHHRPGPGLAQVDFALQPKIPIVERKELVFRVETFNLFNRTLAGNPGTTFTSPASFGIVNSGLNRTIGTGTSRQLQLALRLNF